MERAHPFAAFWKDLDRYLRSETEKRRREEKGRREEEAIRMAQKGGVIHRSSNKVALRGLLVRLMMFYGTSGDR